MFGEKSIIYRKNAKKFKKQKTHTPLDKREGVCYNKGVKAMMEKSNPFLAAERADGWCKSVRGGGEGRSVATGRTE